MRRGLLRASQCISTPVTVRVFRAASLVAKSGLDCYNLCVKAAHYSVVAFPKLDNEAQLQRLRESFETWSYELRPFVPLVQPFVPLTMDELQHVTDHVGRVRRRLHAFAIASFRCVERGDVLLLPIEQGRDKVVELHNTIHGGEPLTIAGTARYDPALWLGRVADADQRARAVVETSRIGRTLGVVDSLALTRTTPGGETRLLLVMPFGIGRVDLYDRFPA